jgi:hypothetical protein
VSQRIQTPCVATTHFLKTPSEAKRSTADLGHAAPNVAVALGDPVAPRFAPDARSDSPSQILARTTISHDIAEIQFICPEQAKSQLSV